jgi:hypothetical protein
MQNKLGFHWSKFTVDIAKFVVDPWLSEYEEKILCCECKKTNNVHENAKKMHIFCSTRF